MKFVKKVTPPDFQAKNFTPSISPNFNSFSKKKHKKLVKIEKFTPLAKILHCRRHWRHWRHWQIPPLSIPTSTIRHLPSSLLPNLIFFQDSIYACALLGFKSQKFLLKRFSESMNFFTITHAITNNLNSIAISFANKRLQILSAFFLLDVGRFGERGYRVAHSGCRQAQTHSYNCWYVLMCLTTHSTQEVCAIFYVF